MPLNAPVSLGCHAPASLGAQDSYESRLGRFSENDLISAEGAQTEGGTLNVRRVVRRFISV